MKNRDTRPVRGTVAAFIFLTGIFVGGLADHLFLPFSHPGPGNGPDSRPVSQLLGEATDAYMAKDYERSKRLYEAVLAQDPSNYEANKFLATLLGQYTQPPDYGKTLELLRNALKVKKEYAELVYYGQTLSMNHQYAESEPVLRECLKTEPNDFMNLYFLGYVLRMQDRKAEALKVDRQALKIKPDSTDIQQEIAALGDHP